MRIPAACLAVILLLSLPVPTVAQQAGLIDDAGLRISWRYTPDETMPGQGLGTIDIQVTDALAGTPIRYGPGRIAAWLQRSRAPLVEAESSCTDKVRGLAGRGVGQRADIDLNTYRLVTLNGDGTLAVVNPFVPMNNAKLESILELGGQPRAWAFLAERMEAWVVLSHPARLVAVDLHARRIARAIELPAEPVAAHLAWESGARRLWVGISGQDGLGLLDLSVPDAPLRVVPAEAPAGLWSDPGRELDGLVVLLPNQVERRVADRVLRWPVPGQPLVTRFSALARRLLVGTAEGNLALIDPDGDPGGGPPKTLALGHPVRALDVFDGGRRALALGGGRASAIDLASGEVTQRLAASAEAEELVRTDQFIYAVGAREGQASLWSIAALRAGNAAAIAVTLGRPLPPGTETMGIGAPLAAVIPAGNGLVMASPADATLYQYGEGMMAPIGSFSNYRRLPLGLLLMDLAPRETAPGTWRSLVRHSQSGVYGLVISGAGPRFAACGSLTLAPAGSAPLADPRLRVELAAVSSRPDGREEVRVRLREADGAEAGGVPDLTLLVLDRRSMWQSRIWMRETGAGEYRAAVQVPRSARYELLAASSTRNLSFIEGRLGSAELGAGR